MKIPLRTFACGGFVMGLTPSIACAPKAPSLPQPEVPPSVVVGNLGQVLSLAEVEALRCDFDNVMRSIDRPLPAAGVDSISSSVLVCGYAAITEPPCYIMPSPEPPHKAGMFCEEKTAAYLVVEASDNPHFHERFSGLGQSVNRQAVDGTLFFRLGHYRDEGAPGFVGVTWSETTSHMESLVLSTPQEPVVVELVFDADTMGTSDILNPKKSFASGLVIPTQPASYWDPGLEGTIPAALSAEE